MSDGLFGFIYNTLLKRVNDPQNTKYWLPQRLQELDNPDGSKLLPIQATSYDLGAIMGEAGVTFRNNIQFQWWQGLLFQYKGNPNYPNVTKAEMVNHQPIPCPDAPWPLMTLSEVTVSGLDNVLVLPNPVVTQPGAGYRAIISLQLGSYPALSQLQIQGNYSLRQCCCSAPMTASGAPLPTACDNWVPTEKVNGKGTFQVTLTNVFIDATIDIEVVGSDSGRTPQITVAQISMRGPQAGSLPDLSVDNLTVDTSWAFMSKNVWLPQAKTALASQDGRRGLIQNVNASLNGAGNRQRIADMFTQQLTNVLDSIIGAVPAGGLPSDVGQQAPNPVDQYLFDRTRFAVNNPASDYYLPKAIYGFSNPQLEPFLIDQVSLGQQTIAGLSFNVQISGLQIVGLSNVAGPPDQLIFTPENINATLSLSVLSPPPQVTIQRAGASLTETVPPPPLGRAGNFCAQQVGGQTQLTGGFTLTLNTSDVAVLLELSGQELDELQITFQQLQLQAAPSDITVKADIASAFKTLINQFLNKPDTVNKILQEVNNKAAQSLGQISQTATDNVKQLIASKLDN